MLEEEGDMIDWDAVDAAYAAWIAQGGLAPARDIWQSSGYASFTFEDYAALGYGDFNLGQLEDYYKAYFVDPGFILPPPALTPEEEEAVIAYCRYTAYVKLWNDIWLDATTPQAVKNALSAQGGLAHYNALLAHFGAASLPNYYHFDVSMTATYDYWADRLEPGLIFAGYSLDELAAYVEAFGVVVTP